MSEPTDFDAILAKKRTLIEEGKTSDEQSQRREERERRLERAFLKDDVTFLQLKELFGPLSRVIVEDGWKEYLDILKPFSEEGQCALGLLRLACDGNRAELDRRLQEAADTSCLNMQGIWHALWNFRLELIRLDRDAESKRLGLNEEPPVPEDMPEDDALPKEANEGPPPDPKPRPKRKAVKPLWDKERRELTFNGFLCKKYRNPSDVQEAILSSFQKNNWFKKIQDPLAPSYEGDDRQRLASAIAKLNNNPYIRFELDGTSRGILWSPRPSTDRQ